MTLHTEKKREKDMNASKNSSYIVNGLALFSMFFGSGNLIFPLFVGQLSPESLFAGITGFLLTAVLVPFLGVIAMVVYKGSYTNFFSCLGKWIGPLLIALLLTVWIPLGSGPRCTTLAYASLSSYFTVPPLWAFSLFYTLLLSLVVYKRNRMIDILGYFLTPALLVCLGIIVFKGMFFSDVASSVTNTSFHTFLTGLQEGYNTMDLIASFFFTASIIGILRDSSKSEAGILKIALKSSIVGVILLGVVYVGLISLAAMHSQGLVDIPKDQLLAHMAKSILGSQLGIISAIAICLACFTTSVALVVVYSEFLQKIVFKNDDKIKEATWITLAISFVMSLFGLEGITFVTSPVLKVLYPTLIILIVYNVGGKAIKHWLATRAGKTEAVPAEVGNFKGN